VHAQLPESAERLLTHLIHEGHPVYITGISALDLLERRSTGHVLEVASTASIIDLAKVTDDLQFPGSEYIDAVFSADEITCLYRELEHLPTPGIGPLSIYYDAKRERFSDPHDQYYRFKRREHSFPMLPPDCSSWECAAGAALLKSRFAFPSDRNQDPVGSFQKDPVLIQKVNLLRILESPDPASAFRYLLDAGYIETHWPLLHAMVGVSQDKDFHPEGDVWDHTMEMFSYLKSDDIDLKLALLLHDCGKAFSREENNNRFDRHAQIGAWKASGFLHDLGVSETLVRRVDYLVRNHMVVAHAPKLPHYRIDTVISSELYPLLLELLRCDISSSFHDMAIYYDVCEHYKNYKRHVKNPYRHADGSRKQKPSRY
jgi:poly(A) polymerase